MIALKDFKTTNQIFAAGDSIPADLENLERWQAAGFVGSNEPQPSHTEVPTS